MSENENEYFNEKQYQALLDRQDFFPKAFLKPGEIRLNPHHGLVSVSRSPNAPDKYTQQRIKDVISENIPSSRGGEHGERPAGHGLLSLFKRSPIRRVKLAICVCVYSESKSMLKSTLRGIQENYRLFEKEAGILEHEIIIIVIFDGIEKMNNSADQTENMTTLFHEIDIRNGFAKQPNSKSIEEYIRGLEQRNLCLSNLDDDDASQDANYCLFTEEEQEELESRLFMSQYNKYCEVKALLEEIGALKKRQQIIEPASLPLQIYKKYEEVAAEFCINNDLGFETQEEIQEYLLRKPNMRTKLIFDAIVKTEDLCERYLQSREDTAILYPARMDPDEFMRREREEEESELRGKENEKQHSYMFFVVKFKNEGKLSSHMLFFQGFCKIFDPQYCILTDVGVKPNRDSVFKMWKHMHLNPRCGGVCGYMSLAIESPRDDLGYSKEEGSQEAADRGFFSHLVERIFSVQRAQIFEYHFAHMLDKPFESAFNYIHVLPGAFSGYRWKALKSVPYNRQEVSFIESDRQSLESGFDSEEGETGTIMDEYLRQAVSEGGEELTLEETNMYLAEDRIMCLGIHSLGYSIHYLPDVESFVDPVVSLTRLLGQRRRWINGSWFAFNYVRENSQQSSSLLFVLQLLYYSLVQKLAWVSPALFFIAMNLTLVSTVREYLVPKIMEFFNVENDYQLFKYSIWILNVKNIVESIPDIFNYIYIMLIFSIILYSTLVNHLNPRFRKIYSAASVVFGLYGLVVIVILVINAYKIIAGIGRQESFIIPIIYLRILILLVIGGHALPILFSFSCSKYVECLTSLPGYVFYVPTYINILQTFAFCRIDDLSWGTKGIDATSTHLTKKYWTRQKYVFVLQYISTNIVLSFLIIKGCDYDLIRNWVILLSTILVVFMLLFRLIPASLYLLAYTLRRACGSNLPAQQINENRRKGQEILRALGQIQKQVKQKERQQVQAKKKEEYMNVAKVTNSLMSSSILNYGNKLRRKVVNHMFRNRFVSKMEKRKDRAKRGASLKHSKLNEPKSIQLSGHNLETQSNKAPDTESKKNYELSVPQGGTSNVRERLRKHREERLRDERQLDQGEGWHGDKKQKQV